VNFAEAEAYLFSLGNEVETMKLGLDNITALLAALSDPQNRYKKVQVAGTNGKGSVCAFLDSICLQAGIKAGLYTSPHLISITERIKIGGTEIADDDFARLATRVRETAVRLSKEGRLRYLPTFFEQITAIALLAFEENDVEIAILETGLGGRFDATTAARAEIAAITRIDLDHQEYLGNTIEEIAAEKAAIISKDTETVVIGAQTRGVMRFLRKYCNDLGIEPINDEYAPWLVVPDTGSTVKICTSLLMFPNVTLGLKGRHQIENAQTAVQIAKALQEDFDVQEEDVVKGLQRARHPGRLETHGRFLFDGAHNPGGATALRQYLDEFVTPPVTMIFGAMAGKDVAEIARVLWPAADNLILTKPENSRAMSAEQLFHFVPNGIDESKIHLTGTVEEALRTAEEVSQPGSTILVTGSLYLVGEARRILVRG
jgi:dihydrofolate synthase / folylpolyglutamate synthase